MGVSAKYKNSDDTIWLYTCDCSVGIELGIRGTADIVSSYGTVVSSRLNDSCLLKMGSEQPLGWAKVVRAFNE